MRDFVHWVMVGEELRQGVLGPGHGPGRDRGALRGRRRRGAGGALRTVERGVSLYLPHQRQRRAVGAYVVLALFMATLGIAFFRIQVLRSSTWELRAESNRIRQIPIPVPRGIIYDRNGKILADNVPGYAITLLPGPLDSARATLDRMSRVRRPLARAHRPRHRDDVPLRPRSRRGRGRRLRHGVGHRGAEVRISRRLRRDAAAPPLRAGERREPRARLRGRDHRQRAGLRRTFPRTATSRAWSSARTGSRRSTRPSCRADPG